MGGPLRRRLYDAINRRTRPPTITHGPMRGLRFTGGDTAGYALGASEPAVQQAIEAHLKPGDVFYDIGANVGFLSLLGAKCVGPTGRVYCFEPQSDLLPLLAHNLGQNGFHNYEIIEAAVADEPGTTRLRTPPLQSRARITAQTGLTRLVTLDELDLLPAAVIKIDVEGAESRVLRGMLRVMGEHQPTLIIEIHGDQGPSVETILSEANYRFEVLNDDGMPHLLAQSR
jgi:FkbM family methyltransferase